MHQTVTAESSLDALAFPDLAPDLSPGPDTNASQDGEEAIEAAALSNSLGISSSSHTGGDIGDDADATVVKAAAQSIAPLRHGERVVNSLSLTVFLPNNKINFLLTGICPR